MIAPLSPFICTSAEAFQATLTVTATDPESPATFGEKSGAIFLRIRYQTDVPTRIFAAGFHSGHAVVSAASSLSPLYVAGSGDAFCWFVIGSGTQIDEVRVKAEAFGLVPLTSISIPFQAHWTSTELALAHVRQPWVQEMQNAQSRALNEENRRASSGWMHIVAIVAGGAIMAIGAASAIIYLPLQAYATWKLTGRHLLGAIVVAVIMTAVIIHAVFAYRAGSGLWPIFLIFVSPVAVAYLFTAIMQARKAEKNR